MIDPLVKVVYTHIHYGTIWIIYGIRVTRIYTRRIGLQIVIERITSSKIWIESNIKELIARITIGIKSENLS